MYSLRHPHGLGYSMGVRKTHWTAVQWKRHFHGIFQTPTGMEFPRLLMFLYEEVNSQRSEVPEMLISQVELPVSDAGAG